ncbi:hypothetical protein BKA70DRAFT_1223119 [Coprinopsis sp. MPI-PUGE-AT-0042]|nr:hypothetical protein BKA70DRAFT_1223119 [Coprinopsis sp. MPI-PUGE-AT-0042]
MSHIAAVPSATMRDCFGHSAHVSDSPRKRRYEKQLLHVAWVGRLVPVLRVATLDSNVHMRHVPLKPPYESKGPGRKKAVEAGAQHCQAGRRKTELVQGEESRSRRRSTICVRILPQLHCGPHSATQFQVSNWMVPQNHSGLSDPPADETVLLHIVLVLLHASSLRLSLSTTSPSRLYISRPSPLPPTSTPSSIRRHFHPPCRHRSTMLSMHSGNAVDSNSGPGINDLPNQPIRDTVIAPAAAVVQVDKAVPTTAAWSPVGAITASSPPAKSKRADRRAYDMVFSGTGKDSDDRDASIEGTAYLTHTLVSNATYEGGLEECLAWCDGIEGCVFVNLYHEFNNFILDLVAQEKSSLKCAAYGEVYGPTQKTNWGGQQSYKAPAPLIYIQESSGYAVVNKPGGEEPAVPEGYELVWGPISRAGYDDGLLDYAILDQYDTDVCSFICNAYVPDQSSPRVWMASASVDSSIYGKACLLVKEFNIWFWCQNLALTRSYSTPSPYLSKERSTGGGQLGKIMVQGFRVLIFGQTSHVLAILEDYCVFRQCTQLLDLLVAQIDPLRITRKSPAFPPSPSEAFILAALDHVAAALAMKR